MALNGSISIALDFILSGTNAISNPVWTLAYAVEKALSDGVGPDQANTATADIRTVAAGSNDIINLSKLKDPFNAPYAASKVKMLYVRSLETNTGILRLRPAPVRAFVGPFLQVSDGLKIDPGGQHLMMSAGAGWAVTEGSADILAVQNPGAQPATYEIVIIAVKS